MNGQNRTFFILLIEDNEDHAELIYESFGRNKNDLEIFHVKDGEEALNYLYSKEYSSNISVKRRAPDLILLDLKIPKINGLEVLETIKADKDLRKIPVVVLSSSNSESDIREAYARHANSYIVKPMEFKNFSTVIKEINQYWNGYNYYLH